MRHGILEGVKVLDLGRTLAAAVAGLLLAEAGAEVVKVEPREGDPTRGTPPFAVWNRSKKSIALDAFGADRALFQQLARGADVLIHDCTPAEAKAKRLDEATLRALAPGLIVAAVTGFPAGHDDEEIPPMDALVLAASGVCDEQAPTRRDGPVYIRFPLGSWGAAWLAAIGIATRLYNVRRGGKPGAVRTSLFQGALVPMLMHWWRIEKNITPSLATAMPRTIKGTLVECGDGVWLHLMRPPDKAPLMRQALEAMDPEARARANADNLSPAYPNWGASKIIFKTRPSAEWLADLWASDIPVQPALPLGALYYDEQARANDYIVAVDDPVFGKTLQPGAPFAVSPPAAVQGPAPRLDADRDAILSSWRPKPAPVVQRRFDRPLEGLKVVDFGNFLAGPLAPMMMADLGAEVIKLEAVTGDQMRITEWAFLGCQRNKRSIAADMKHPATREIVERLVRRADVVHHNLRMPAAAKLGIDYPSLRAINPRLVYCHVSSYGPVGPSKDWPGFDQLFQAASGWEYEGAGQGNPPMWHRFGMMDHQAALASLFATLLGLIARERTGEGQFVAASLLGASLLTTSETLVLPDGQLAPYPKLDALQLGVSDSERLYRVADGWLMLATDDAGLEAFAKAAGAPPGAALEERLGRMTLEEALAVARKTGAAAAPARLDQKGAFFDNPANQGIALATHARHTLHGKVEQPGALWQYEDQALAFDRCAPLLGEHTNAILTELGFSEAEIRRFVEQGAVLQAK